jgi:hypothetical protein
MITIAGGILIAVAVLVVLYGLFCWVVSSLTHWLERNIDRPPSRLVRALWGLCELAFWSGLLVGAVQFDVWVQRMFR